MNIRDLQSKHRKSVFSIRQELHNINPLIYWNKPIILKIGVSIEEKNEKPANKGGLLSIINSMSIALQGSEPT
jgi:hypothetical protein